MRVGAWPTASSPGISELAGEESSPPTLPFHLWDTEAGAGEGVVQGGAVGSTGVALPYHTPHGYSPVLVLQ